jgi:glyceraldehyde 3-phosphate dehydrogenase
METVIDYEKELNSHIEQERAAVRLSSITGELLYHQGIELVFFRNHLNDVTVAEVLKLHTYSKKVVNKPVDIFTSVLLAKEILNLNLAPAKLDIGKLSSEWLSEKEDFSSPTEFLKNKLSGFELENAVAPEPRDVVLYGFGRIGRLAARELIKQAGKGQQLRLRGIVTRSNSESDLIKRAALLKNDSVHGAFDGTVAVDSEKEALIINGQIVKMICGKKPEDIDYTQYGINNALIIDNTGVFTNREALSRHLQANGVSRVLLTAPGKGIPNIVYGINQGELDLDNETIYSAASCTTNAISPVLKVINDTYGVVKGTH